MEALQAQIAALEAADEHRNAELAATRAELAEARAQAREAQARVEERRQLIENLQSRLDAAEEQRARAEQERAAVIASMGWRARRRLGAVTEPEGRSSD
ncbi:MAG: hypothetical protein GEU94_08905 [Micromonosporaceae bacterium]|nr:hypothetical protein [Micromonosporaceae bacterium]